MKTVIMAGGRGTRIAAEAKDARGNPIPKPLIEIGGMPILEHEIRNLVAQGFTDIIITTGYLGEKISAYFGDGRGLSPATGEPFGANISYFHETTPLGNAGALFRLRDKLTDDFLLLNADSAFSVDFRRFAAFHREKKALATLFVHPNSHPYDSGLIIAAADGQVEKWLAKEDERPQWYKNCVNAGLHIISPRLLDDMPPTAKIDLDRQILKPLAGTGKLYAYHSSEYVMDMGTPDRLARVRADYDKGLIAARNLARKQRAVFLDRDGTINKYVGFLTDIDDFVLLPGAAAAVRRFNAAGYLVIVATNQPVIARGELSGEKLRQIHDKLETLLGADGAYLDDIYVCPHHPDSGYAGEIAALKIDCDCRKPKPGLLLKAAAEHNIDLAQSWMIGDSERDILAGKNAGCKTGRVGSEAKENLADAYAPSLLALTEKII